jgi:hypothetical protein
VEQRDPIYNGVASVTRDTDIFWLDLSQVQVNPYFNRLFAYSDQIQHRFGRWELTLYPSRTSSAILLEHTPTTDLLLGSIGSMHVTNPPCKTLGVYHASEGFELYPSFNKLLFRVHNGGGVRIAELVTALESCASTVVSSWRQSVENHRQGIAVSHWIDDRWRLPAAPTIVICLNSDEMADEEVDYETFTGTSQYRDQRIAAAARMGY